MADKTVEKKNLNANPFPEMEKIVLDFWQKSKIFDKSVNKEPPLGDYVFYDGPPFATGLPHYGHIAGSIIKDAIPRYATMKGYRVERKWGWDCHGLPVENLAETELGLKNKQDIEALGVEKFNNYCESLVLRHENDWRNIINRIGRWVDMENDYKTMDTDYMESIWWVFKELGDKNLIYQGYKSMHICPRCGTTLANFEVGLGYKTIKDISATVKFKASNLKALHANLKPDAMVYFLAWTTTPWTLIGNVALAVGEDIDYAIVLVAVPDDKGEVLDGMVLPREKVHEEFYIVAKDKVNDIFGLKYAPEIIGEVKGKELVGSAYEPVFDYYYSQEKLEHKENGWKVYAADFVSTEEGTGIVHIAPAFGEADMLMGQRMKLPFVQHVDAAGRFKDEVTEWAGMEVKPKDNHQQTDIEVIKHLAGKKLLFSKEKIEHSYPHCWRCDTPLLNYASQSWFVKVSAFNQDLIENNNKVNWIPEHIQAGRFGKWLSQARDWSISRNRYWGDPLPVWRCDKCDETRIIGSLEELREADPNMTKIIISRHGESEKNLQQIFDTTDNGYPLTENGVKQASLLAEKLKEKKIDKIYSSPVLRAVQTAKIVALDFGLGVELVEGLRELNSGSWEGKTIYDPEVVKERSAYHALPKEKNYETKRGVTGESWKDIELRSYQAVKGIIKEQKGKTILLITHQGVIIYLLKALKNFSLEKSVRLFDIKEMGDYASPIEVYIDAETGRQVDLHKQFVDRLKFECTKCGGSMKRIPEVLDCWFESGAMPYAQLHYPFEDNDKLAKNFPAEFIAEGIDQTRGWFYTLMVLSGALYNKPAYKNVVANGIVLADDGQKMSKRLKNYPDPLYILDNYSADAMRYYLLASPVMAGENLNFSEQGVKEVLRNTSMTLWNVYKFYEMFKDGSIVASRKPIVDSENILDKWITAKLNLLIEEVTGNMDKYFISKAIRPVENFISDLSTWYLRRSRNRFKGEDELDKQAALSTTSFVLTELSKVMAPFMPFIAEQLWQKVTGYNFENEDRSVHLEKWPEAHNAQPVTHNVIEDMDMVRKIVELGLAERDKAGIKVRQPLSSIKIKSKGLRISDQEDFIQLIKDEVNVKEVIFSDGEEIFQAELDTVLTEELSREGIRREAVRIINGMRKDAGLTIKDKIRIYWSTEESVLKKALQSNVAGIMEDTLASGMEEEKRDEFDLEKNVKLNSLEVWFAIIKK